MNEPWIDVDDDMPPMEPHGQDGSTVRVLVKVEKDYWPKVYCGSYQYDEDGGRWDVDTLYRYQGHRFKVTHWMLLPKE